VIWPETEVIDGVYFTAEREKDRADHVGQSAAGQILRGLFRLERRQLDSEMESGAWILTPAKRRWSSPVQTTCGIGSSRRVTVGKWVNVDQMPEDPSMN